MAKNNIELAIGSKFDGEGFQKLNTALKQSSGNVRRVSGAVGTMLSGMDGLTGSTGKLVRTAGGLIGGFLSMGVWGVAIAGVTKLVGWLGQLNEQVKEARLAAKGLSKEYMTLEAAARGYQRRVESWKQKKADRDNAEKQAAEAARKAREAELKAMDEKIQMEKEYDQYLMKTAALKEKIAGLSDDQIAVNSAKRQVEFEKKWGGRWAQGEAELKLELAKKEAAKKLQEQTDAVLAEIKAQEEEKKAAEENAKAKKEAAKKEAEIAKLKEDQAKKAKQIDEKVAALRQEAARLENNAARARGGVTFGEWQNDENKRAREERRAAIRQKNVINNAKKEIAQLEEEKRFSGKGFNPARAARLAKLREFVNNQDPNNNPALQQAEQLEKEKMDLIAKTQRDISDIAAAIKDNIGL